MIAAIGIYILISILSYELDPNPSPNGYTDYDPCIRCGEDWGFYSNNP